LPVSVEVGHQLVSVAERGALGSVANGTLSREQCTAVYSVRTSAVHWAVQCSAVQCAPQTDCTALHCTGLQCELCIGCAREWRGRLSAAAQRQQKNCSPSFAPASCPRGRACGAQLAMGIKLLAKFLLRATGAAQSKQSRPSWRGSRAAAEWAPTTPHALGNWLVRQSCKWTSSRVADELPSCRLACALK